MLKSKFIVPIHIVDSIAQDSIYISEMIMKEQKIPKAQHITIQFGVHTHAVKVLPNQKNQGIFIHPRLAQQLGIPPLSSKSLQFDIQYMSKLSTIKLGPLLSVLINKETPEDMNKPFGVISSFCRELAETCHAVGATVYFFTPSSIPLNGTFINGWILDGEWKKRPMPLAEIIYNRLPTRQIENQAHVQRLFTQTAKKHNIFIFNERFLDKHDVFHALQDDESVKHYLPESLLLEDFSTLKYMINKYYVVYVKPVQGSLGRGIYRIISLENPKILTLEKASSTNQKPMKFSSISSLYRTFKSKLSRKQYQIQQGLSVIQVGRSPVDFRALVQKNSTGAWSITSIVARTAGNERFVANLARGGSIDTVTNTLPRTNLPQHFNAEDMLLALKRAAIAISEAIDSNIDAHFGELGVDLAIDVQGKVWLIEVNSKPSKNDNTPLRENKIRPSVRKVVSYAKYLTGFKEGRNPHGSHRVRSRRRKN
ncbi:YheC/YheD family endospore coat-associated protein [Paenibacillus endoradicis]|uniref:YheC/YheD family endospore coat-associated protein n=1 Tax=Paenibacillus endoradicis TaxID=2972487 RepID=UPI002158D52E|nr:YheC/YheD family protein [Paenibacillus endoradicis]MCR8657954.1 YheC/YheD family protein [Paenibacillus endoradicis]